MPKQNKQNGRADIDPNVSRLQTVLYSAFPKFLRAANETEGIVKTLQEELLRFGHSTRIKALFGIWAPTYLAYWRITRHERATEECIKQLDNFGTRATEKIFRGKGLDLGTGTGLLPVLIGRVKEAQILEEIEDDETLPDNIRSMAASCRCLQRRISRFMEQGEHKYIEGSLEEWLRDFVVAVYTQECKQTPVVAGLEPYIHFGQILKSNPRAGLIKLINDPVTAELTLSYIKEAMVVENLIKTSKFFPQRDGSDLLVELRTRFKRNLSIIGIDLSPEMLEVAKRKAAPLFGKELAYKKMFVEGDVLKLLEPMLSSESRFDFITISQLIHLLPDNAKKTLIDYCSKLLTPEGKLIIFDEWDPIFVGQSLIPFTEPSYNSSQVMELENLLFLINFLFKSIFNPISKARMRELIHQSGLYYSRLRATCPISLDLETTHVQSAQVFTKKPI